MEFVRSQTTIPIPRVYAAFVHENNSYIVMDFVENDALESFYPDYLKTSVASVHEFVNFLVDCKRQLVELGHSYTTDPPFCSWSGEAYNNRVFDPPLTHRLHLYEQFQDYWKDQWDIPHNPFLEMPRSLIEFSTSPPSAVLCHGDLVADNVLVKDGKVVAIIDWDTLGFYPHFWEAAQAVKLMLSKETPVLTAFVDDALGSQEEQEIKDWVQKFFDPDPAMENSWFWPWRPHHVHQIQTLDWLKRRDAFGKVRQLESVLQASEVEERQWVPDPARHGAKSKK
ncbi:hypothetical protein BT69DRAFT_1335094 [Atractiella rhizophila]|nr:hypothetical protein BT69DRAFT_1335094 [Atractiella rhizophila]